MLTALLLLLAAPPPKEARVLVRYHAEAAKEESFEVQNMVTAAVGAVWPPARAHELRAEALTQLDALLERAGAPCAQHFEPGDSGLLVCQSQTRQALEARGLAPHYEQVLDVSAEQLVEKPNIVVEARLWSPRTGKGLAVRRSVPSKHLAEEAAAATIEVFAGKGTAFQRAIQTPDEAWASFKSPFKKEQARRGLPVVQHSRGCTQPIPPQLLITPDDGLTRTLSDRWQSSAKGNPLSEVKESCTLLYLPLFEGESIVHVRLTCGAVRSDDFFRAARPLKESLDELSDRLIASQLEQRCTGNPADNPHAEEQLRGFIETLRSGDENAVMDVSMDLELMGKKAVPFLVAELASPQVRTRLRVLQVLGSLGAAAREAVPALEKAGQDPDPAVAAAAQRALRRISP